MDEGSPAMRQLHVLEKRCRPAVSQQPPLDLGHLEDRRNRLTHAHELACCFLEVPEEERELLEQYVAWRAIRRVTLAEDAPRRRTAAS